MNNSANPCSQLPLELLLAEDRAAAEDHELTNHVEQCEECRSRLAALAGDPMWWNNTKEFLSGTEFDWRPDASWTSRFTADPTGHPASLESSVARLLDAPSHPELLGRIGRYDVERVIGSGGMGIVLKAHDSELNRPVAIKLLASHLAHVGAARERFSREGRAAAAVVHEHVVAIYNVETGGAVPFLVMQYVPGRSLQSRVDAEGPLAAEEILRIGMQAAAGLAAAHAQGLVHRDVKPSNILLEDTVERAVLTDFGLARTIDDASLTHTGVLAGTPHYMSPEQASGEAIDHRSDLFSLGAVLYFMATGHPPFRADGALAVLHRICRDEHRRVWQLNNEIPDDLSDLIDQLLEKSPSRRPKTAADVRESLAGMLSHIQQYGPGRRRARDLQGRQQRLKQLGFAGLAIASVLVAVVLYALRPAAAPTSEAPVPPAPAEIAQAVVQSTADELNFAEELAAARSAVEQSEAPVVRGTPPLTVGIKNLSRSRASLSELKPHTVPTPKTKEQNMHLYRKATIVTMVLLIFAGSSQRNFAQEFQAEATTPAAPAPPVVVVQEQRTFTVSDREFEAQMRALDQQQKQLERQREVFAKQREMMEQQAVASTMAAEKAASATGPIRTANGDDLFSGTGRSSDLVSTIRQSTEAIRTAKNEAARAEATDALRQTLGQYFEEDMKVRSEELANVAARLEKLQEQLERRRTKKEEIIDLQVKVALNEADGLGFYSEPKPGVFEIRVPMPTITPFSDTTFQPYPRIEATGEELGAPVPRSSGAAPAPLPRIEIAVPTPPAPPVP